MKALEHVFGERAGGVLPDPLKHDVTQVIEHHAKESPCGIAKYGEHDERGPLAAKAGRRAGTHCVHRPLEQIGQRELGANGEQDQHAGDHDPPAQGGVIARPKIRQEAF